MGMSRPSGRQASHRIASAPLRAPERAQEAARLGAVRVEARARTRAPAEAEAPVRGRLRRRRAGSGRRFQLQVSACSRGPPGRGHAVRSSCAQLLRCRRSYTISPSGNEFPEGKSPDRDRESGGSKCLKLIKFHPFTGCPEAQKTATLMEQFAKETLPVSLEAEMRRSYLDYAMSVIVGRALPDVRDGLKPVHRRVLFAMHEANTVWNRPYVKCARIVGDVLGKYHPHGDSATYEALVRMAQDFSMRYMLIDGQGNFGSVDGDAAAAYRYTECRLEKIASELLADIDKETVDFVPNYDGKEQEPSVLPTRIPNLLINGSAGIAVGMATNVPPHSLHEIVDACLAILERPEIGVDELMEIIPGPDFPTRGIIYGTSGVKEGYRTGRGRVVIRARTHMEELEKGNRQAIVIDELPYQVNKSALLIKIGELVRDKRLDGLSEIRDESDKSGMRVVLELKRGEVPEVILNNLYKETQMQDTFWMNMVALVDGQPRLLNLKEILDAFLRHRREVVTRRSVFELRKARERGHILEGLAVALSNVDEIIALIKAAPAPAEAKRELMSRMWRSQLVENMLARD